MVSCGNYGYRFNPKTEGSEMFKEDLEKAAGMLLVAAVWGAMTFVMMKAIAAFVVGLSSND